MTQAKSNTHRPLRVWLPAVRAGSGADVFVERLAQGLERWGHEPIVQWFPHRYELTPWMLQNIQPPTGTDIVHANTWQGFAFKRQGIPLIATEHHDVEDPNFGRFRSKLQTFYHRTIIRACLRRSYLTADDLVAVSQYAARVMQARLGRHITYVHNWVDTEQFIPRQSSSLATQPMKPFRLLFVGNPSIWKGADVLPELAKMLGSDFEIRCLGGLRKHITFVARPNVVVLERVSTEQMPRIYHGADAALVTSRYEAFGYVALEAMACGLPVLGFDSTGTSEVCVNGQTALLVPVNDLHSLATQCRALAADRQLAIRLGNAGRARAIRHFNETSGVANYLALYLRHSSQDRDRKGVVVRTTG